MKNSKARALFGMNHWRSNTQQVELRHTWFDKSGKRITAWVAIHTKTRPYVN
ncbi:hypothetical protein SOASR014_42070 [Pectobacterium carotovorum subsp. carotovorum]|nr:hypothetical protein SOASR014_42070 [Pectobacterium carotovorum subsp. carotovorum]GLX46516.1 hypothetical protein Pcaca01_41840 [Pectobacterium carotovorum subsp. carotovorum]